MLVVDELSGNKIHDYESIQVVTSYLPDGTLIRGYVDKSNDVKLVRFKNRGSECVVPSLFGEDNIIFSNRIGEYIAKQDYTPGELAIETGIMGVGRFPYPLIERKYEAIESFFLFKNTQKLLNPKEYLLSDFFPYTFGLEFETSQGYIPEDICFRDGLIPLRDGSISGIEYSTVVLNGNEGLGLLEQQLETLKKYTFFNKECSLHIHIGGFPLNPKAIYILYNICKYMEEQLSFLLPRYTFETYQYKDNGKDYCKRLPVFRNFNQMYEYLVGRRFYGDFTQGHPNDIERKAKWRIGTRYYSVNFINLLCYNVNKTVEFRFLRPSYNFEKIILWLYIFNAIMRYAEKCALDGKYKVIPLNAMLSAIYPPEIVERLKVAINGLSVIKSNQENNNDYIGRDTALEDMVFTGDFNIIYK